MSLEKVKDNNVSRAEGSVVSSATGAGLMEHEGKEAERADTDKSFPRDFCLSVVWWETVGPRGGFKTGGNTVAVNGWERAGGEGKES